MNNQLQVCPSVIVCSPEPVRAHQWSVQLAEVLGAEFAVLESAHAHAHAHAHAEARANGLAAEIAQAPRVTLARTPELIDTKLAEDTLVLVLVESPSEYVARELMQGATNTFEKCDDWVNEAQNLLNFFQRNRSASVLLLTHTDMRARPEDCLEVINGNGLDLAKLPGFPEDSVDPIVTLLGNLVTERHIRSRLLYEEILIASSLTRQDEELGTDKALDVGAVATYLQAQLEHKNQLERLSSAAEEARSELELAHLQSHQLQEELETILSQSAKESSEKNQAVEKNQVLTATLEKRESELELAHLQVHQLQEELETLQSQLNGKPEVTEEWGEEPKDTSELDLKAELELALLQIHQLQEELEIYYQKYLEESAKSKQTGVLGQHNGALGGESLRVMRLARTMQCGSARV